MYRKLTRVTDNLYQVLDMKNDAANRWQTHQKMRTKKTEIAAKCSKQNQARVERAVGRVEPSEKHEEDDDDEDEENRGGRGGRGGCSS